MIYPFEKVPKAITDFFQSIYTHYKTMIFCQFDTWKLYKNVVDYDTLAKFTFLYAENYFLASGVMLFNKDIM